MKRVLLLLALSTLLFSCESEQADTDELYEGVEMSKSEPTIRGGIIFPPTTQRE